MILVPVEPKVRNRTRGNCHANFGFAALVPAAARRHARKIGGGLNFNQPALSRLLNGIPSSRIPGACSSCYAPSRAWHTPCERPYARHGPTGANARVNAEDFFMLTSIRAVAQRPNARRWLAATAGLALGLAAAMPAKAQDTIKVGVLHSLSGTMAISETTLKDVMLMLIDEQNKKGGLLGKKLEAVVVDPAWDWPLIAEKARGLLEKDKVAGVCGCWTSVSRKSVLPVFEKDNGLLFYPVQYEGEESSKNVIYTGAAPNQQAIPAVDYLMKDEKVKRWVLAGTDYVYPRFTFSCFMR